MAIKTYQVTTPLAHDGELYQIGDTVEIDDKRVKTLLDIGAVVTVERAAKAAPKPAKGGDE